MRRPPITPPPVFVIPPPRPDEVLPPPVVQANPIVARSLLGRVVRAAKIGAVCLLLGLVIGQLVLITQLDRRASSAAQDLALILPTRADNVEVQSSKFAARSVEDSGERSIDAHENTLADDSAVEDSIPEEGVTSVLSLVQQTSENHEDLKEQADPSSRSLPTQPVADKPTAPTPVESLIPIESLTTLTSRSSVLHPTCEDGTCKQDMDSHGTVLKWANTPGDAFRMADQQEKLVFMIHVSGNFEIPGFT